MDSGSIIRVPPSPETLAGALPGDRWRVLHRDRRRAPASRCTRSWAPGSASAKSPERSRTCSPPVRPRSCSSAERSPRFSSRGFRETQRAHRRPGGHARGGTRRGDARWERERVRRAPGVRAGCGAVGLAAELRRSGASRSRVAAHVPSRVHRRRPGRGAHPSGDRRELPRDAREPGQPRHHDVPLGDLRRDVRRRIVRRPQLQAVHRLHAGAAAAAPGCRPP